MKLSTGKEKYSLWLGIEQDNRNSKERLALIHVVNFNVCINNSGPKAVKTLNLLEEKYEMFVKESIVMLIASVGCVQCFNH